MKTSIVALLVALVGAGCASSHHARYESPAPPQVIVPAPAPGVVVVPQMPPPGHVVPRLTENEAAEIARSEAYRHGWHNVSIEHVGYWDNHWHVDIGRTAPHHEFRHGFVEVAPDGTVLAFGDSPRQHAYYHDRR
jgi:hypothetical protein